MRQKYIKPTAKVRMVGAPTLLDASGNGVGSDSNGVTLDYKGRDDEGTVKPSAKKLFDDWELE